MATQKITINSIKTLQPGEIVWDTETKGFGCRMQSKSRVFILKYRMGSGRGARQYIYTLGKLGSPWTPDSARDEAKRLLALIAKGINPALERKREKEAANVKEAFEQYMDQGHGKRKPRTVKEYTRKFVKYVEPDIGAYRVNEVAKPDILRILKKLESTPIQANRVLVMMKAFFNWCAEEKLRDRSNNPCDGIHKHREKSRERFLTAEELHALGAALMQYEEEQMHITPHGTIDANVAKELNTVTPYVTAALRLLILTGARLSEILTLEWRFVDFERKQIRLPDSKTGEKTIPLNAPALQILSELARIRNNPFVICGKNEGAHLVNIKDPWHKIRKRAGLDDVRIHDLRHSFASVGLASGLHLKMIGSLLGHRNLATTEKYAHLANDPLQNASEVIGSRILEAMSGVHSKKNVVNFGN